MPHSFRVSQPRRHIHNLHALCGISLGILCLGMPLWSVASGDTRPNGSAEAPYRTGVTVTEALQKRFPQVNYQDLHRLEEKQALDLKIVTTVGEGLNRVGDEFYAKLSRDYTHNGQLILPKGTIVHGSIVDITGAKRMARDGHMSMKFDYLITPDGREIPIEGAGNTADGKVKAGAKVVATSAGYALGGGVIGAVTALKYGGLALVAATNGYSLAIGAGVGAVGGLAYNLLREGESALLQTGTEMKIKLKEGMVLPSMTMPDLSEEDIRLSGLDVKLLGFQLAKDPFGENKEITLTLDVSNATPYSFSVMDMAVGDEDGRTFYASPFGDTGLWFSKIDPNTRLKGNLSFNVDDPTQQLYLIFYKRYTHQILSKIALNDRSVPLVASKKKR
jgi:hypothetical protein